METACLGAPATFTLDLKSRLMTPFERLSAVRSAVPHTDMLLLSLLDRESSTSSVPPTTAKDRPADGRGLFSVTGGSLCFSGDKQRSGSCSAHEKWALATPATLAALELCSARPNSLETVMLIRGCVKHHPQAQFTWQDAREAAMSCGLIYQFKDLAL